MKKIDKLTKQQEAQIPVYLDKWLKHGLRTTTMDRDKARSAVDFLYVDICKKEKPKLVIFLDSPMAMQLAISILKNTKFDVSGQKQLYSQLRSQLGSQLRSQLGSQLGSQLYSQLESQLESQLRSQLRSQLDSQLGSQLESQLYSQLYSQLGSQLDSQLGSQLYSQLGSQLGSQLYSQLDSRFYGFSFSPWWWGYGIPYYGFYEFILKELFPARANDFPLFLKHLEAIKELHYVAMYNEIAIVSDFPQEIHRNERTQLHRDGGAALLYRDTYAVNSLNGIIVPDRLVNTPAKELKAVEWLKEPNVDIRREAFRKIGIDEVILQLGGQVVDTYESPVGGLYELMLVDIGLPEKKKYLKMRNQSIGEYHVEGIPQECVTVQAALAWRMGLDKYVEPKFLT